MKRHWSLLQLLLITLGVILGTGTARADKPSVIRIAYPGVGVGNRPFVGGDSAATTHLKGLLDEEFKADGIKVTWTLLRGAGPAVNELYANGLLDFSALGDLPFIVGQASGLKRKVLLAAGIRQNTYLAVPADSSIQSIKDLNKGACEPAARRLRRFTISKQDSGREALRPDQGNFRLQSDRR